MSLPGSFPRALFAVIIALLCLPAQAADKKKPADPPAARQTDAQLRIWKAEFPSKRPVQISLRTQARKGAPMELANSADGFYAADYVAVPAGNCTIDINQVTDPKAKLATLTAQLIAGSFYTILVQEREDTVSAEIMDDRPSSAKSCELIVRNFVPTIATLELEIAADVHVKLNTADAFLHLCGLPRKRIELQTSGTDASGKAFRSSAEVDFTLAPRATVLLQPDAYGRIRSRVMIDGQFPPK